MKLWTFAQECEPSIDKIICDLTGTPVISKPQINHFVVYFKWTFWGSFVVKTPYLEALEFSCTMLYNHKYPSQKSQLNIGGNTWNVSWIGFLLYSKPSESTNSSWYLVTAKNVYVLSSINTILLLKVSTNDT